MEKYFEINAPGSNIRCKAYYRDKLRGAERAVLFCTGFAGHKDNAAAARFAEKLLSKARDAVVVVFNWPAHGDDVKKRLTLEDCDAYLTLLVKELKETLGVRECYVYATSFGAYLVLKYISEHENPFEKIALRCPAVDMYDVLTRTIMKNDDFDRILKGKEVQAGFDRKIAVTRALLDDLVANDIRKRDYLELSERILILHGTADEVASFEVSRTFADDNLIEFIPVEGADHRFRDPAHMSLANKRAMEFFGF
ncbi:MAG: alpha/beta fold hydrolase [Clostridia bacterium]|nr:alpha/beta fold hydrolase [Clostridia bacterium]